MAEELSVVEEIRDYLDREPFQSFTIVLNSGDRYLITEKHGVALGGSSILVAFPKRGHTFFPPYNVTAVELHEAPPAKRKGK